MRIIPVVNIPTGRMANIAKGNALNQKFVKLGTLVGKSYKEISAAAGPCKDVTYQQNGSVKQWYAGNYRIVLLFDKADKCLGVHSETRV